MIHELHIDLRMLLKNPRLIAIAVFLLALSIVTSTAILQLLGAMQLDAVPTVNSEEVAAVRLSDMGQSQGLDDRLYPATMNPIWEQLNDCREVFSGILSWETGSMNLAQVQRVPREEAPALSERVVSALLLPPELGRIFDGTDQAGCSPNTACVVPSSLCGLEWPSLSTMDNGSQRYIVGVALRGHPSDLCRQDQRQAQPCSPLGNLFSRSDV